MKNTILLFALLLLMVTQTKAQTSVYHPFPDSNAYWNEESIMDGGTHTFYFLYSININGDTIIGGESHHKLFISGLQYVDDLFNGGTIVSGYYGAIRQDTLQKKVFIVLMGYASDTLLYDFNITVGDTLPPSLALLDNGNPNVVTQVDSILMENNYRKRFNISNVDYFIEGMGSLHGLLGGDYLFGNSQTLHCFIQDGQTLYTDSTPYACEINQTGVNELSSKNSLSIYPNPATDKLYINSSGLTGNSTITIYNLLGETIYTIDTNRKQETVNCKPFSPGIYFLQLKTESGSAVRRFVKE